jgi:hypothetical protein
VENEAVASLNHRLGQQLPAPEKADAAQWHSRKEPKEKWRSIWPSTKARCPKPQGRRAAASSISSKSNARCTTEAVDSVRLASVKRAHQFAIRAINADAIADVVRKPQ